MPYASDVAFTESVKRIQRERGSRKSYERLEQQRGGIPASAITPEVAAYIAEREERLPRHSECGGPAVRAAPRRPARLHQSARSADAGVCRLRRQPAIHHHGKPRGENERAFLFLMNYAAGERIKIWGRARVVTEDQQLLAHLIDPHYDARVEQAIVFDVRPGTRTARSTFRTSSALNRPNGRWKRYGDESGTSRLCFVTRRSPSFPRMSPILPAVPG